MLKNSAFIKLFILNILLSSSAFANGDTTARSKSFSISIGANHLQVIEENLHPKTNSNPGIQLTLQSLKAQKEEKYLREWELLMRYSRLRSNYEDLQATVWAQLRFRYGLYFLASEGSWGKLAAGPLVIVQYNSAYYPIWDDSHIYFNNQCTLNGSLRWQKNISAGRSFYAHLDLPLFGAASRPEELQQYKIEDLTFSGLMRLNHSNISPIWLGKIVAPRLEAGYKFASFGRLQETVFYSIDYMYQDANNSKPYRHLIHTIGLKFEF